MTNVEEPFGVGVIGCSATSRFVCERLSLRSDLRLVATWSEQRDGSVPPLVLAGIEPPECRRHTSSFDAINDPHVRVLFFAAGSPFESMRMAIEAAKSIVVETPFVLPVGELERLALEARSRGQVAAIFEPRRWEADFLQARAALESGRLGRLLRLRYAVHEQRLPDETYPLGVARELGGHVLDQMLQLAEPNALTANEGNMPFVWCHFPLAHGYREAFVASFERADGVSAIIEVQTRSLLGFRSGWMIEGIDGAYRHGRLYTRTTDGEIVDEPLLLPPVPSDPFFDALASELRGNTADLPTVREAVRVAALLCDLPDSTPLDPALRGEG